MEFEWDREKAGRNARKHRVSFEEAVTVFYDSLATAFPDPTTPPEKYGLLLLAILLMINFLSYRTSNVTA